MILEEETRLAGARVLIVEDEYYLAAPREVVDLLA